ncbi:MAG: protein TolR [Gammaproteobacteria bacterium RIFCSPHIGHO2_12_FULL_45_9]|nr:MAG: protein TolR [Gammaproteobacteria bacterium RIFCSPHIGHO2_12_FULL_45_9]
MATLLSKTKKRRGPLAEINVVPYIDVMLVLLVIFMITAPLLSQGVTVNLPKASAKVLPPKAAEPIVVSVNRAGQYFLNARTNSEHALSLSAIQEQVATQLSHAKEAHQIRDVLVKGDQAVDYGKVMAAMVALQQAGADNVGLVTESPPGK